MVKRRWCGAAGLPPDRVYHCAVMPCYDKKLEASREDFWVPGGAAPPPSCGCVHRHCEQLALPVPAASAMAWRAACGLPAGAGLQGEGGRVHMAGKGQKVRVSRSANMCALRGAPAPPCRHPGA